MLCYQQNLLVLNKTRMVLISVMVTKGSHMNQDSSLMNTFQYLDTHLDAEQVS